MTETAERPRTAPKVGYGETELRLPKRLAFEQWLDICKGLGAMSRAHQWWIGDALNEGERRFGEEWSQGEVAIGIAEQTQANWKWIAGAIDPSRRRESPLTFSHHAEVARLEPELQDILLGDAIANLWTVRQLRDAVALKDGGAPAEPEPKEHTKLTDAEQASIARRLETLQESFERWQSTAGSQPEQLGRFFDADDVGWLLRTIRNLTRSG